MADANVEDRTTVPWLPPVQADLGLPDETLVDYVRDATLLARGMATTLHERRPGSHDVELVVAGALVHDVSKLYEFDGEDTTAAGDLLGHHHFGIHVVAQAGLPTEIGHIVLSHTHRTTVEPATLEAEVVKRADQVAAAAIRLRVLEDLRND